MTTRRLATMPAFTPTLAMTLVLALAAAAPASAQSLKFKRTVINEKSNFEACGVADVNKDGKLDIVSGDTWYEAPDWKRHFILPIKDDGHYRVDFANTMLDVDGDGWVDVVSCNWHEKSVVWRKNPGSAGGEWPETLVDEPGNSETAITVDVDGDGKMDFLPDVQQKTIWYRVEGNALKGYEVDPKIGGHGLGFGDVNGDGRADILKPGGWFEAPVDRLKGGWVWHAEWNLGATGEEIIAHDFTGDGLADVWWSMGHDYGVFWMEQTREAGDKKWIKHEIDKDWSMGHAARLADLNNDGRMDILTGKRKYAHDTDPGAEDPQVVFAYFFDPGAKKFTRETIHQGGGDGVGLQPVVIDIDGDGDLDLVLPGKSGLYLHQQETGGGPVEPKKSAMEIKVPEGFEVTLFASEPMIRKPIAFAFDEQGRMVVAEAAEYPLGPAPGESPHDAVKILEDKDGDGAADTMTVFADGLNIPDAVAVGHGGIYVAEAPNVWFMRDTDGDGRADEKKAILTGFGTQDSHHNVHGLAWTPEGRLLMNQGCSTTSRITVEGREWNLIEGDFFRCWPDGTGFEIVHKGFTNSWGYDWDDYGNWFCNDNEGPHLIHLVDGADYGFSLTNRHDGKPGTLPGVPADHAQHHGYLVQTGLTIYSGDSFPAEYNGAILQGSPNLHKIVRDTPEEMGASFYATMEEDLTSSEDPWHRPLALAVGPDGAVYMTDWYNEILAHVEHPLNSPRRDKTHGRIYRIGWKAAPRRPIPDVSKAGEAELTGYLKANNKWLRRTAQRRLAWLIREGKAGLDSTLALLEATESPRTRCHALWTLAECRLAEGEGEAGQRILAAAISALGDPDAHVRANALRLFRTAGRIPEGLSNLLFSLADDPDDFVKFEAALVMAGLPATAAAPLERVTQLVARADWRDPYLAFAFGKALKPSEARIVDRAFVLGASGLNGDGAFLLPALYRLRDPRTEPLLEAMLRMEGLRADLTEDLGLGLMSFETPGSLRTLVDFAAARPDSPARLTRSILNEVLRQPDDKLKAAEGSVRDLLRALNQREGGAELRRARFALAARLGDRESAPAILAAIADSDAGVAETAMLAAGELNLSEAAPALLGRSNEEMERIRWAALRGLSRTGGPDAAPRLVLALEDPNSALDALQGLARIGASTPAGLPAKAVAIAADGRAVLNGRTTPLFRRWIESAEPEAGRPALMAKLSAAEGVIRDWRIIGPFPNEDTKGHARPYPPESELNADAEYPGAGGKPVRWAALRAEDPNGIVGLMHLVPNDHAVAYGWATIDSPSDRPAVLYAGSDDSIKIWLNGEVVLDHLVDRGLAVDQERVAVRLKAGTNTVLLKCGQNGGGWNFHCRIAASSGEAGDLEAMAARASGDPGLGEKVFYGSIGCHRCHSVDGKGGRVGPDLSLAGRNHPRSYIARSLLHPSAEIAEGYGAVKLKLAGGEELEGFIHRESESEIRFVDAEGRERTIPKGTISARTTLASSGMPEDLVKSMSPADVVNVIAFLESRR